MRGFRQAVAVALSVWAVCAAQQAQAAILLENLTNINGGTITDETRNAAFGILTRIEVGASDVAIDGFGVFGRQTTDGNVKFAIFNESGFNRVYVSDAVATATASALQWYDSPAFTLNLLANNVYYFGLLSDQSFVYRWALNVGAVTANGLTSAASDLSGTNGNFDTFADPAMTDNCCIVQMALRIGSPGDEPVLEVPEPAGLALIGLGLTGIGILRRRSR